jgi:hypothetical protein
MSWATNLRSEIRRFSFQARDDYSSHGALAHTSQSLPVQTLALHQNRAGLPTSLCYDVHGAFAAIVGLAKNFWIRNVDRGGALVERK